MFSVPIEWIVILILSKSMK